MVAVRAAGPGWHGMHALLGGLHMHVETAVGGVRWEEVCVGNRREVGWARRACGPEGYTVRAFEESPTRAVHAGAAAAGDVVESAIDSRIQRGIRERSCGKMRRG
jgi:hypothetical protein